MWISDFSVLSDVIALKLLGVNRQNTLKKANGLIKWGTVN